jgi:hypothetical protein
MENKSLRHLRLVDPFEGPVEGPITRLDLWYRFPPISKIQLAVYITGKLVLLAVLYYFIYGTLLK